MRFLVQLEIVATALRAAGRARVSRLLVAVASLAIIGCFNGSLVENFHSAYQPRTHRLALGPLVNLSPDAAGANAGRAIRQAIYSELKQRQDQYSVEIQDIAATDQALRDADVADSLAERMTSPALAHLLNVDAVMRGVVTRYKKKSVGRQVANALVFGYASGGEVRAIVAIYDGGDGQATWTYNINLTGEIFTTPDGLRKWAGHAVAVTFPYKKSKH